MKRHDNNIILTQENKANEILFFLLDDFGNGFLEGGRLNFLT